MENKCKLGYKEKDGKCVKSKKSNKHLSLGKIPKHYMYGLFLIALGMLIYYFRPLQSCLWWNLLCHAGALAITPIFVILAVILIIAGVFKIIWGDD